MLKNYITLGTASNPIQDKVQAIKDASIPENVSQLHAFLGLMNYYSKFIPQAAARLASLYKLLRKNSTVHNGLKNAAASSKNAS